MKISAAALAALFAAAPAFAGDWAPQINADKISSVEIPAPAAAVKALPKEGQNYSAAEELLIKEFFVTEINVDIPEAEVMRQDSFYDNAFCFEHALRLALATLLYDYSNASSPMARELSAMGALAKPSKSDLKKASQRVFDALNSRSAYISMLRPYKLNQPLNGEPVEKNWIFFVRLNGIPYWAVVDRSGETAPYVYGG